MFPSQHHTDCARVRSLQTVTEKLAATISRDPVSPNCPPDHGTSTIGTPVFSTVAGARLGEAEMRGTARRGLARKTRYCGESTIPIKSSTLSHSHSKQRSGSISGCPLLHRNVESVCMAAKLIQV